MHKGKVADQVNFGNQFLQKPFYINLKGSNHHTSLFPGELEIISIKKNTLCFSRNVYKCIHTLISGIPVAFTITVHGGMLVG